MLMLTSQLQMEGTEIIELFQFHRNLCQLTDNGYT